VEKELPGFLQPQLFGVTLQCCVLAKYLVAILDSKLTMSKQVEFKVKMAHNLWWVLWHDMELETKNG
jgi:hypothetical protein